jgi:acyl-coenzyme A synthetase/AMP-(fatty) acid ligase
MHIVDMVYFWARTMPQHPAVIQPDSIMTYANLADAVEAAAASFARDIVDKSKPVAVSIASGPKMLVASLGLLRAGFSIILAYPDLFEHLSSTGTRTLVHERGSATLAGGINILFDETWLTADTNVGKRDRPFRKSGPEECTITCFTSGSTGRPKRVIWTRSAFESRMLFPAMLAFTDYQRVLIVPGLSSSFGMICAHEALYAGRTICLATLGQRMLWMVNTFSIDAIIASSQQALQLSELQEKVTHYPLNSLKALQIAGSIITREGVERIIKNVCRNVIIQYASTEAGPVATAPYDVIADIPGAVGFIVPDAEVEVVDATDRSLPPGVEGFVRVRTPIFLARPGAGASATTWFYPGDLGWITDEGVLCIAGRRGDVLNRGGVKLSITDFEDFLLSCPGVQDAGVCTLMGTSGIEEVWIGVVLEPSTDLAALRQKVESNRDFGPNIDRLFVVEAIPRGTLGKVQRDELKKMLQEIGERTGA